MNNNDVLAGDDQNDGTAWTPTILERQAGDAGKGLTWTCVSLCLIPVSKTLHHEFEKLSPAVGLELGLQILPLLMFFSALRPSWMRSPWVRGLARIFGEWIKRPFPVFVVSLLVCNAVAFAVGAHVYEVNLILNRVRRAALSWLPVEEPDDPLLEALKQFRSLGATPSLLLSENSQAEGRFSLKGYPIDEHPP